MTASTRSYDAEQLRRISELTIAHYDRSAEAHWHGTRDHDVNQNYAALLDAIEGDPPYSILDLGCGPGRDLRYFRSLGHDVVGLDGSTEFVAMARCYSESEVLRQDFLAMKLPKSRFEGIFANASLFHVPSQELPRVLAELSATLRSRGVLFCSNPRGNNEEGFSDAFAKMPSKRLFGNFIARKFCWRTLALRIGASHGHEFRRSIQAHDVVA